MRPTRKFFFLSNNGIAFVLGKDVDDEPLRIALPNNKPIKKIIPGSGHVFYFDIDGKCFVSGNNALGQFGTIEQHAITQKLPIPVTYPFKKGIKNIIAGFGFSFFEDFNVINRH